MNKDYALIADLPKILEIKDDNLMIVEDKEDTKHATLLDFKKSLSGDYKDPSDMTFYSSKKIETYMNDIKRSISGLASDVEVKSISKRIEDIIAGSGDVVTDQDIINELNNAKDGEDTLNLRLKRDIDIAEDKYAQHSYKTIQGNPVSTGSFGYVDIYIAKANPSSKLIFKSKNILDIKNNINTDGVTYTDTGFIYQQTTADKLTISMKFANSIPKGKYAFFADIKFDALFRNKGNIKFILNNSKDSSAYFEYTYDQSNEFWFRAPKAFNEIQLEFDPNMFVENATVEYKNIMLMTDDKYQDTYIPYSYKEIDTLGAVNFKEYNEDYDISCDDPNATLIVSYYDHNITLESMSEDIKELQSEIINNRDKCGLIKNYGDYLFFDEAVCETPTSCRISYDEDKYMRNGKPSLKMTFAENVNVNPILAVEFTKYIDVIESVSLVFYIDKTDSYYFNTQEPIKIYITSDSYKEPEMVNYLSIALNKNELVQGWNIIKRNLSEFTSNGLPNIHALKYVKVEVIRDTSLDNKSIYFNSIIFNQKMKPTVLLAFDGIYEEGIEYTYPYLTSREVPATILANNRSTFSTAVLNEIVNLRIMHGWDVGQYGCNPNKELLTYDDNPREQYLALKTAKEWLQANFIYDPISYSAPYGNLRPISVPILKDLGYKIAKTDSTGYCNFFDPKFDFAIPMQLFSNETTEKEILEKLQYAIDNNCCICLYTNNVTNYGNEADSKKILLEAIVKFISDNKDKLTAMTLSEFYNKCNS